jgi:pimeloyl-ACP methyl ester carboxylesterase
LVRTLTLLAPAMPDLRMDPRRMSDPRVALTMLPLVGTWVRRILIEVPPEEQIERMLRLCFADPSVVASARRAEAVAECVERIALTWAVTALRQSTQQLARSWLMPSSRSLWWVAAQVQAPALVVWGAADKLVTVRKAPRTAAALPRGRLLVLPRTGHLPQMEQPTSVARAMLGMIDAVDRAVW